MDELAEFLKKIKESDTVELKTSERKVPPSFYETYSAFANTKGGTIYLGIKEGNPNEIVGVDNPDEQVKAILSTLENKQKTSVNVLSGDDCEVIEANGKKIIKVTVREATRDERPVYLNGSFSFAFKRMGDGDVRLLENEIAAKIVDRNPASRDLVLNSMGFGIEDLDKDTLLRYRERLAQYRPSDRFDSLSDQELLTRIGAYRKGKDGNFGLTDAAILFFGKWQDIKCIYPDYFLDYQYWSVAGLERWTKRFSSEELSWSGNIFDFFLRIEETIPAYLPNPFMREAANNYDGKDILDACLEIVVNALSNASYFLATGVRVKQMPHYFHAENPGGIIVGKEQALMGGLSSPRNPSILSFFRLIGMAEKSGLGVPKIFNVASRYGFPEPSISVRKDIEITSVHASFLLLPIDTPSRETKMRIISYLADKELGSEGVEIARDLKISTSLAALCIRELVSMGIVITNRKKKKGRKIFLSKDYR